MATAQAPNDPVTIAVVGTATIAKDKVIPALNSVSAAKIVGVSSRSKDRATAFAKEHNAGKGMTHDEVLDSPNEEIQAVW